MRCKVFYGTWYEAKDAFNKWAKGKALAKDVIIHTHAPIVFTGPGEDESLMIVVFHPEGEPWEKEKEKILETMAKI